MQLKTIFIINRKECAKQTACPSLLGFTMLFALSNANAQHPSSYESSGRPSPNHVCQACFGGNCTINIQSDGIVRTDNCLGGDVNTFKGNDFSTSHIYTANYNEYTGTIHYNEQL